MRGSQLQAGQCRYKETDRNTNKQKLLLHNKIKRAQPLSPNVVKQNASSVRGQGNEHDMNTKEGKL